MIKYVIRIKPYKSHSWGKTRHSFMDGSTACDFANGYAAALHDSGYNYFVEVRTYEDSRPLKQVMEVSPYG